MALAWYNNSSYCCNHGSSSHDILQSTIACILLFAWCIIPREKHCHRPYMIICFLLLILLKKKMHVFHYLSTTYSPFENRIQNFQQPRLLQDNILSFLYEVYYSLVYYVIQCCRLLLCHSVWGLQAPPCLSNRYILFRSGPVLGALPCLTALLLVSQGGAWLNCLWFCFSVQITPPPPPLFQNDGPFILPQLLLKAGWTEW